MNSMYFTEKQAHNGEMVKFIKHLMELCYGDSDYYIDIHIKPADCGDFIVEWAQVRWDHSFGGSFVYVEEDQHIVTEKMFPDHHYEYFESEEQYNERFKEWMDENPGWEITPYGTWTNTIENEKFKKMMLEGGRDE